MHDITWHRIDILIENRDIVFLRFIAESYENLFFLDKCSRVGRGMVLYVTAPFLDQAVEILEDLSSNSSICIVSRREVKDSGIRLKYY